MFDYMYAIFYCPTYRERYAEFLKIDFPRVPLTSDRELFRDLVRLGGELVDLHLMRSGKLDERTTRFPVAGSNEIKRVRYEERPTGEGACGTVGTDEGVCAHGTAAAGGRVWINEEQHFEGVEKEAWEFHIGGYQVLEKWLKDRKGRKLSYDDIRHWQRVVVALSETMRIMGEIDERIERWPIE